MLTRRDSQRCSAEQAPPAARGRGRAQARAQVQSRRRSRATRGSQRPRAPTSLTSCGARSRNRQRALATTTTSSRSSSSPSPAAARAPRTLPLRAWPSRACSSGRSRSRCCCAQFCAVAGAGRDAQRRLRRCGGRPFYPSQWHRGHLPAAVSRASASSSNRSETLPPFDVLSSPFPVERLGASLDDLQRRIRRRGRRRSRRCRRHRAAAAAAAALALHGLVGAGAGACSRSNGLG